MSLITPTLGRKIWYMPNADDKVNMLQMHSDPLDATIVYVHPNDTVNLAIFDAVGKLHTRQGVRIVQAPYHVPAVDGEAYAMWMPYQVKVADPAPDALMPLDVGSKALAPEGEAMKAMIGESLKEMMRIDAEHEAEQLAGRGTFKTNINVDIDPADGQTV